MSLWLKFESLGKFGNYRIPLSRSNFAGYKYLAPSAGQLRCLWVLLGPWNFGRQKRGGSRQMVPSPEPFVSLLQICWSECPQTSHHPTTNTLIPEKELEVLQLGAHKVLLPLLFDLQHRFEAAEVIGIAKLFFAKPQQHCNQSTSLVHSPPPNSIESCTWYSWTCNAWKKQAGSRRFCWPNTEFCSILAVSCPWWSIIPICDTASAEPSAEFVFHRDRQNFVQKLVLLGGWALDKNTSD